MAAASVTTETIAARRASAMAQRTEGSTTWHADSTTHAPKSSAFLRNAELVRDVRIGAPMNRFAFAVTSLLALGLVACGAVADPIASEAPELIVPAPDGADRVQCTGMPSCDPWDDVVVNQASCLQDDARCYARSMCGSTVWCTGRSPIDCEAYPECPDGAVQVSSCDPGPNWCTSVTLCGTTIHCESFANCMAFPSCDEGDSVVPSESACLLDDARCYPRTMCGSTIWCSGPLKP
jgi:hypothetical protein